MHYKENIMRKNQWTTVRERKFEQSSINDWLLHQIKDNPKAVFLTLKFRHKQTATKQKDDISLQHAQRVLRVFLRKLDMHYFSQRAVTKGIAGIPRMVFQHMGAGGDNVHYHIVALPHVDPEAFVQVAEKQWASLDTYGWIDHNNSWFEEVGSDFEELKDATFYAAREVRKLGAENSWMIFQTIPYTPSIEQTA